MLMFKQGFIRLGLIGLGIGGCLVWGHTVSLWASETPVSATSEAGMVSSASEQAVMGHGEAGIHGERGISDEALPLQTEGVTRTPPLFELGPPFLGTGPIGPGFKIPTGAIWQPSLTVWGTYRTAFQAFDNGRGPGNLAEWANRLDLFTQLRLTGTERFLLAFRPIDEHGRFTGYNFTPNDDWVGELDPDLELAFFEGDIGEIFPGLDPYDSKSLDLQFSVGRQPIIYQDGLLINDIIDSVALVKHNIYVPFDGNMRLTALYGFSEIHRNDNLRDSDAQLAGLFTKTDFYYNTVDLDIAYVDSDKRKEDGIVAGLSSVQRIGPVNTTFRVLTSQSFGDDTPQISDGTLLFSEISWTPPYTHNILYWDLYWAIDRFSSAARGPDTGGSLGRTGILHEAVGLGGYGSALLNRAENAIGTSVGYQMFFDENRKQLTVEIGGREATHHNDDESAVALGASWQQALGRRTIVRLDTFGALQNENDQAWGARLEFLVKF